MFVAGAVPTGLAGWWIGVYGGGGPSGSVATLAGAALGLSLGAAYLAWRWFAAPLRELERGLERWTRGDLATPLDETSLAGWRRLGVQFSRAQEDMRRAIDEANSGFALERARLETLVERIPDALVITNMRGEVQFLNKAALPVFGGKLEETVSGGKGLLQPADASLWRLRVQDILKTHTTRGLVEMPGREGGSAKSYRTSVSMFTDPVSGDFGVLIMLRDQTAECRLEAMKEEFFQAAAHDLRAPLFAVQGYLRLLKKSLVPDERQQGWIEAIDHSCERLTALVKDVLDSARMDSGQLKLESGEIQPESLLRRVKRLFQPMADERGIKIEMRIADNAPPHFFADERLIDRLMHNLLANALKFTPRGGTVTIEASAAGSDRVELVVSDTGPGIPGEQRAAVFEKFRQLDSGAPHTGFGLGLSICAKIIKLHKGEIWVQPSKSGGAEFVSRLPLVQSPKEVVSE